MSSIDLSLYECDVGLYEYRPGLMLPSIYPPHGHYSFPRHGIDAAINVQIDDSDILFPTFMKSGQNWTLTIIRRLKYLQELQAGIDRPFNDFYDQNPYIESSWSNGETGVDKFNKLTPPRVMKSHLPLDLLEKQLEKHPNLRVLQIIRNPRDTLVSLFHHLSNDTHFGGFKGTWDQFFEEFKNKRLPYGDYFEINSEWYKFNKGRQNSLVIKYEDMKKDTSSHVIKIAKFTGHGNISKEAADFIAEKCTVKIAKEKFNPLLKDMKAWKTDNSGLVRKGEVGDWKNYFNKEQCDYVDAKCKEYFEPLGLTFEYSI